MPYASTPASTGTGAISNTATAAAVTHLIRPRKASASCASGRPLGVPTLAGIEALPQRDGPTVAHTIEPRDAKGPQVWRQEHPPAEPVRLFPRHEEKQLVWRDIHRS